MFEGPNLLRLAYAANILILVPVVWSMFFSGGTDGVFEGKVVDSEGLRLLVGSLWFAILIGSLAGLSWPAIFAPLLLVQMVYKSVWLIAYVWPHREDPGIPVGISIVFLMIVLTYPLLLWFSGIWRSS
ncbi:hypothetical protein BPTFM16_00705 [Altererythrobacter insulae]|nr:hypothetical protein BPTFM16_00705 [Altererythrobacter insulae]